MAERDSVGAVARDAEERASALAPDASPRVGAGARRGARLPSEIAALGRQAPSDVAALGRQAGNRALARLLQRETLLDAAWKSVLHPVEPDPKFGSSGIQSVYDANKAASSDRRQQALWWLDSARTGPWKQLDWDTVVAAAADRIFHPEHIQQNPLGLCGPAAGVEYDAGRDPLHYAMEVASIFEDGKAAGKALNGTLLGNAPPKGMNQCDWMVLSAIQDVTNYVGDYYGTKAENDEVFGAGLNVGQEEKVLERFAGCVKTTEYSCSVYGVYDESMKANALLTKHGDDVVVVMEVDSTTLQDEDKRGKNDHFIRLLRPMDYNDAEVKFTVFTWGSVRTLKFRAANFEHMVDGYIVGARRSDIEL